MPGSNGPDGFLNVPARSPKPRTSGLTHVIDKGLNLREIEGLFDTAGDYVDIVKLGWGTSYVTQNLEKKIALYRSLEAPVVCGGTLSNDFPVLDSPQRDAGRRDPDAFLVRFDPTGAALVHPTRIAKRGIRGPSYARLLPCACIARWLSPGRGARGNNRT